MRHGSWLTAGLAAVSASLLIALPACYSYSSPLGRAAKPSAAVGYVFGRFKLRKVEHQGGIAISLRRVQNNEEFQLELKSRGALYAVALPPGRYRITEVVFVTALSGEAGRKLFLPGGKLREMRETFEVPAARLVYLGDFIGSVPLRKGAPYWRLHTILFRPAATVRQLRRALPNFRNVPAKTAFPAPS